MSSDGPPTRRTALWREAAVAVALIAFAVWLRTRNLHAVFVEREVLPSDADCSYHMRKALLALEHFPRVPSLDPWVAWPDGARPTNGPGADLLFAAVAFVLGAQGAPDRAEHIIAWVPVALGVACSLAAALTAARLEPDLRRRASTSLSALTFATAIPVAVRVSSVGFTDHHVFESLAPLATLAWVASRNNAPPLRWEALGAALIAGTVGLYPGTLVSHALLAAGLALHALLADVSPPRRLVGSGAPAFAMAAGLLGLAVIPWALSHRQWFHHLQLSFLQPTLLLGAAAALALVEVVVRRVPDGARLPRGLRRLALATATLALTLAASLVVAPALRRELVAGLAGWLFTRDPWMATIAECLPMFHQGLFAPAAWRDMIYKYSLLTPLAPALAAVAVRRVARRDDASAAVFAVMMLGLIALTLLQHRFARALVGPLAVAAALALGALVDRIASRRDEAWRGWSSVALAALWIASEPGVRMQMATAPPAPLDGVREAEIALRRPGVEVRRGVRAGVLTSWDAGNDSLLLGRRPVIETGFGPYIGHEVFEASERAWRAPEAELVSWLDRRDVGEVLIWGRHVLALGGAQPPLANKVTPDGRTVLNVEYLRRYPIAVAMLAGSGNARYGIPHLSSLRPRFASRQFTGAFAVPLPWAWVFERVRGVRLHGAAPEGTLVRATLPLSIWAQRRVWEGWTRARGGAWSITVPIPTAQSEGAIVSAESYTIYFEERPVGRAQASLSDVRAGRDIEVSTDAPPVAAPLSRSGSLRGEETPLPLHLLGWPWRARDAPWRIEVQSGRRAGVGREERDPPSLSPDPFLTTCVIPQWAPTTGGVRDSTLRLAEGSLSRRTRLADCSQSAQRRPTAAFSDRTASGALRPRRTSRRSTRSRLATRARVATPTAQIAPHAHLNASPTAADSGARNDESQTRALTPSRAAVSHRAPYDERRNLSMRFVRALTPRIVGATAIVALSLHACGGDDGAPAPPVDASTPSVDVGPQLPAVRIVVDGDRNGTLDDTAAEWSHRAEWSTSVGAMFMANVDDDDRDHAVDASDETVNGDADAADLARIRVPAWAGAPEGSAGTLSVDMTAAARVRIFKRDGGAWSVFSGALSRDELRAGVELGIEAKDFPSAQWNGHVTLSLAVTTPSGERTDTATMRVAPWMIYNSLDPTVRIWGPQASSFGPAVAFSGDLEFYAEQDAIPLTLVDTEDPAYLTDPEQGPDVWMQDIMEFGWTGFPGPDGMHAMPVVLRTPNTQRAVAEYSLRELLGPDFGYVWKHSTAAENGRAWDVSLDSFGDLELLPPHRNGDHDYPLGRIVHGSVPERHSDNALRAFLEAQSLQGPPLYLDTSWELVGHVDEFLSFIPADTPRGWKLLWASPRLARQQLMDFVARDPHNADALIFAGKSWYYESGPMRGRAYPAQRAVGNLLADTELMAFNQMVQGHLDALREQVQSEVGLSDDEIVEVPFLWASHEAGRAAAYQPGTINLLYFNHNAIMARPYGPTIAGDDMVEDDMTQRLGAFGINVQFAEQWDLLHAADGEVHCGTNAVREFPTRRWWEVAR